MTESAIATYLLALGCLAGTGVLMLVHLLVVDFAGIRAGHKPGHPVAHEGHSFHFRAVRAHANLNESIAAFILLAGVGIAIGATPWAINAFSAVYLAGRILHAVMYWLGFGLMRSIGFGIALVALLGLAGTALVALATPAG